MNLVRSVIKNCRTKLKPPKPGTTKRPDNQAVAEAASAIRQAVFRVTKKRVKITHYFDKNISEFMAAKNASRLCTIPAITPDEFVYVLGPPMWLDSYQNKAILRKLNNHLSRGRKPPVAFLIKPIGLFIVDNKNHSGLLKEIICTYFTVRSLAAALGPIRPLTGNQRQFVAKLYNTGSDTSQEKD